MIKRLRRLLFASILILPQAATAQKVGDEVWPKFPIPGCKSRADIDRYIRLLSDNNENALQEMDASNCGPWISRNTELVVDQTFSENLCVRPKGQPTCVWVNRGWMKKKR